jgi:hypothetical protein
MKLKVIKKIPIAYFKRNKNRKSYAFCFYAVYKGDSTNRGLAESIIKDYVSFTKPEQYPPLMPSYNFYDRMNKVSEIDVAQFSGIHLCP